jgi:hypothetical protein
MLKIGSGICSALRVLRIEKRVVMIVRRVSNLFNSVVQMFFAWVLTCDQHKRFPYPISYSCDIYRRHGDVHQWDCTTCHAVLSQCDQHKWFTIHLGAYDWFHQVLIKSNNSSWPTALCELLTSQRSIQKKKSNHRGPLPIVTSKELQVATQVVARHILNLDCSSFI